MQKETRVCTLDCKFVETTLMAKIMWVGGSSSERTERGLDPLVRQRPRPAAGASWARPGARVVNT